MRSFSASGIDFSGVRRERSTTLYGLLFHCLTIGGLAFALLPSVQAQTDWPSAKPIRLIVPFTAGSGADVVARVLADRLGPALGNAAVVVENRPGAGGTRGAAYVARSAPDGYTLLVHSAGHLVNPWIYIGLPYDTARDFAGVTPIANLPNVLVTSPGKFSDVADLIAQVRAKPGGFNYGSSGNGSATHLNAEVFRSAAGLVAQHIPFRGGPEAITEVLSGRVDWSFAPLVVALPLIQSGKLKALAVGTATRSSVLPDLPTTSEAGAPGSGYLFWVGLLAPAHTPRPIVDRLATEVSNVMATPETKSRLASLGAESFTLKPEQFDQFIAAELIRTHQLVIKAHIKLD